MGAIANGLSVSGLRAYTGTFLTFSDYMKPPMRLAALMETPVIFIFTHDSIGVGEDGPTHQPIEQLAGLRAIPGMHGGASRRRQRGRRGLAGDPRRRRHEPACLVLSRQAAADARPHDLRSGQGRGPGRLRPGRRSRARRPR